AIVNANPSVFGNLWLHQRPLYGKAASAVLNYYCRRPRSNTTQVQSPPSQVNQSAWRDRYGSLGRRDTTCQPQYPTQHSNTANQRSTSHTSYGRRFIDSVTSARIPTRTCGGLLTPLAWRMRCSVKA